MMGATDLLLTFYGDDFTGSTDALEFLTRAGARTVLFVEPPTAAQLAAYPGVQAVGVAGMTRSMPPDAMETELRPALSSLSSLGAPHVHYKVCSTFDSSPKIGSIGRVIDLGAELFRAKFAPLLVGAPPLGRHCVFGNLFARFGSDGDLYRLDRHPSMSRHPVTPSDEGDLRLHLGRQTRKSIALFDILKVHLPEPEAHRALEAILTGAPDIVLFDILYPEQLRLIGALIDRHASHEQPLFSVGSSGIEMALGAHWIAKGRLKPVDQWPDIAPGRSPVVAASGSCSPVTNRQIAWARNHGFDEVPLDVSKLTENAAGEIQRVTNRSIAIVKSGRSVVVHSNSPGVQSSPGQQACEAKALGSALGRIVCDTVRETGARRIVIAGGDTSSYAARAMGIQALEMIAPISPGAPLCRAHAPGSPVDGLEVNFKGGQVGPENYLSLL